MNLNEKRAVKEFAKKLKNELGDNLLNIRLFGSKVRHVFTRDSDIDILIILAEKNSEYIDKIVDILVDIQLEYDANISPVIYTEYEYTMNRDMGTLFVENVEKEGVYL